MKGKQHGRNGHSWRIASSKIWWLGPWRADSEEHHQWRSQFGTGLTGITSDTTNASMMTLNLDSRAEVSYLKDLAHGLRISPSLCAQIHQRFGVPVLQ
jgi:hypothetical protein